MESNMGRTKCLGRPWVPDERRSIKVMSEYQHGDLKSGSGGKVKSRKQAVAIALNEARSSGGKIPKKKAKS
jgi:hypothetical protein